MADTTRVTFTRPASERIAAVVRKVEQGDRNQAALKFSKPITNDHNTSKGRSLCGRTPKYLLTLTSQSGCGTIVRATAHVDGDCPGPIDSVEITDGGSGWARLARLQPTIQLSVPSQLGGTTYTPTISSAGNDDCGLPAWQIASVSVSGGQVAPDGSGILIIEGNGTVIERPAVLQISGGSVVVVDGGRYYLESLTDPAIVLPVTLSLAQASPSDGEGAEFTPVVNSTVGHTAFGSVTSVTIDDGGAGYLDRVWEYDTTYQGIDFTDVQGYDGRVRQILGHEPEGCLKWYSVTTCGADTSGVCCVDGEINGALTTQAACEAAGGTWKPGALPDDLPGPCCP